MKCIGFIILIGEGQNCSNFGRLDEDRAEGDNEKVESDDKSMEVVEEGMEVVEESMEVVEESTEDDNESKEEEDQRRMDYKLETSWEHPRSSWSGTEYNEDDSTQDSFDNASLRRLFAERRIQKCAARVIRYSSTYPHSQAGAIVSHANQSLEDLYSGGLGSHRNPWAPFTSEIDWKVAHWAKMCGPGSTAFSELLAIGGVSIILL